MRAWWGNGFGAGMVRRPHAEKTKQTHGEWTTSLSREMRRKKSAEGSQIPDERKYLLGLVLSWTTAFCSE
jgi:hypothetical protein